MGSEDETSLIYGLEFPARSLATLSADTDLTKFLVGTQTLKIANNQVHVVEVNEETSELLTQAYPHPQGELWHLHWSPQNDILISSCYNTLTQEGGTHQKCSLWNIIEDDNQLKQLTTIDTEDETRVNYVSHVI
uniref:Protein TSSC1 n=3 Tax=Lygus hesperus TaxID=30085 RepID=A0A0A9WZ60_LYGHE